MGGLGRKGKVSAIRLILLISTYMLMLMHAAASSLCLPYHCFFPISPPSLAFCCLLIWITSLCRLYAKGRSGNVKHKILRFIYSCNQGTDRGRKEQLENYVNTHQFNYSFKKGNYFFVQIKRCTL